MQKIQSWTCRQADLGDLATVSGILTEAAEWLRADGQALWDLEDLTAEALQPDIASGLYHLFETNGEAVATLRFQLEDEEYWPDLEAGDSAFIHRVAIRRSHAGKGFSSVMLQWALDETARRGRKILRLDCDAARPKLRAVYENFGFTYRDDRKVGALTVARFEMPTSP